MKRERDQLEEGQADEEQSQAISNESEAPTSSAQTVGEDEDGDPQTPSKKAKTDASRRKSTPKPQVNPNAREDVLKPGTLAPDFTLPDHEGKDVTLSDFRGRDVVLYFYPKDNTPACTQEAQQFTKYASDFLRHDIVVLGISCDSVKSHQSFVKKFNLNVRLLSDRDMQVIQAYNVVSKAGKGPRRVTYVIGKDGIITRAYPKVKAELHPRQLLEDLLPAQSQALYDITKQIQAIQQQALQQYQQQYQLQMAAGLNPAFMQMQMNPFLLAQTGQAILGSGATVESEQTEQHQAPVQQEEEHQQQAQ